MNRAVLPALAFVLAASPAAGCDGGSLFEMLDAPLPPEAGAVLDVEEVESTDGGEWHVYFAADGRTAGNLVRHDYGEGGRWSARLVVSSPEAYAVTTTRFIYSAPYYVSGATTVREEKDIYVFCGGNLLIPEEDFAILAPDYADKAAEALAVFDAREVARYLPALAR